MEDVSFDMVPDESWVAPVVVVVVSGLFAC
jgi:hypothetical protein